MEFRQGALLPSSIPPQRFRLAARLAISIRAFAVSAPVLLVAYNPPLSHSWRTMHVGDNDGDCDVDAQDRQRDR